MQPTGMDHPTFFQELGSVFHIIIVSLQDIWDDIWSVLVINLVWTLCTLLVVPGPPATLALYRYANRMAHGEIVDTKDFFGEFRSCWGSGWRWGVVVFPISAIFVADILLSNEKNINAAAFPYVQCFYIALLVIWLLLQTQVLAFMIEQEKPEVKTALRNSLVMLGKNFHFSIAYYLELILMILIGIVLCMTIFIVGGVLLAVIGNRAVVFNLERNKAHSTV